MITLSDIVELEAVTPPIRIREGCLDEIFDLISILSSAIVMMRWIVKFYFPWHLDLSKYVLNNFLITLVIARDLCIAGKRESPLHQYFYHCAASIVVVKEYFLLFVSSGYWYLHSAIIPAVGWAFWKSRFVASFQIPRHCDVVPAQVEGNSF